MELRPNEEARKRLEEWLSVELEDALSARQSHEAEWAEDLRLYEGVPKKDIINVPVANAPNTQITLGAIACDSIYAQALDTILTVDPLITMRPTHKGTQKEADALQVFAKHVASFEAGIAQAAEDGILDDVQLGTGFFYVPWVEEVVKKRTYEVRMAGPRIVAMPVEDVLVPAGAKGEIEGLPWLALRFYLTKAELTDRANLRGWDTERCTPTTSSSDMRAKRQYLGRTSDGLAHKGDLYEVWEFYCAFDIDGDGVQEDLFAVFDRGSQAVLFYDYNPYEHRPGAVMRYQKRAHLFYGIGVMSMIKPFQEEVTDIHNWRNLNMRLANARIWAHKTGALAKGFVFWENRRVELDNPKEDLIPLQMGDIYPSSAQAEAISTGLASRRVGEIEQNFSRPSALMGSRTPATTALTAMNQVNRRFTAAFNAMRECLAEAVRQCLYRYQERVMAGDQATLEHIRDVSGPEAETVIQALRNPRFDDSYVVEMTASSAAINKMQDRNDAMLLVQILTSYYQGVLQMVQLISDPMVAPPVKEVAQKIAEAASNVIERVIRTFDQVRDPEAFVIEVEGAIDGAMAGANPGVLGALAQLLGGPGGAEGPQPALGAGGPDEG